VGAAFVHLCCSNGLRQKKTAAENSKAGDRGVNPADHLQEQSINEK
jgi:hypothetical protein